MRILEIDETSSKTMFIREHPEILVQHFQFRQNKEDDMKRLRD